MKERVVLYDWEEALAHLKMLGHDGKAVTKIAAFRADPPEPTRFIGVFESDHYAAAIEQMKALQEEHPTLSYFVGPNPLDAASLRYADNRFVKSAVHPKKADIVGFQNIVFDFDPTQDRDLLTDRHRAEVRQVVEQFMGEEAMLAEATVVDSGHGVYLLARLPAPVHDEQAIRSVFADIQRRFAERYRDRDVFLDKLDLSRFMGLAGTVNTKLDRSIWRRREIIREGGACNNLAKAIGRAKATVKPGASRVTAIADFESLGRRVGGWCNGYQELLRTVPAKGKRSKAAFLLALKMDRDGWAWEDIENVLRRWGKTVFVEDPQKIERILAPLPGRLRDTQFRDVLPSHKSLRDVQATIRCRGNCDVELGIQLGRVKGLLEVPISESRRRGSVARGPQVEEARERLSRDYTDRLVDIVGRRNALVLSAGPPGIGKTRHLLRQCAYTPCVVFVSRTEEIPKVRAELQAELDATEHKAAMAVRLASGLPKKAERPELLVICPRNEACEDDERRKDIKRLEDQGHARLVEPRVCSGCPRYGGCAYYRQFHPDENTTVIATSAWFRMRQLPDICQRAKLLVFDEDPLDYAFDETSMTTDQVQAASRFVARRLPAFAGQLATILDALADASTDRTMSKFADAGAIDAAKDVNVAKLREAYNVVVAEAGVSRVPGISIAEVVRALQAKRTGRATRSMLVAGAGKVTYRTLRTFPLDRPVIVLDATGERVTYKPVFPHHKIEVSRAKANLQAEVIQICDQKMPEQTLSSPKKQEDIENLIDALYENRKHLGEDGFAVIGKKSYVDGLDLQSAAIMRGHYWGERGSRRFERCHTLVLVGAAEPDFVALGLRADLFFGEDLSRQRTRGIRRYGLDSSPGMEWVGKIERYTDERLHAFYKRQREGEMVQAAYRIRPLDGPHKLIVLLSNIPLPGLPPSDLVTFAGLQRRLGLEAPPPAQGIRQAWKHLYVKTGRPPTHQQLAILLGVSREHVRQELARERRSL